MLFWVLMLLWFLFGLFWNRGDLQKGDYGFFGSHLLLFILLFILGWAVFGFVVQ
jgi:hypothetical protein